MQAEAATDVQAFLNEHRFSAFQWLIFAMCFVVVLLDGFDTAAIGYIAPSLITEWGVRAPGARAGAECRAVRAGDRRPLRRARSPTGLAARRC